MIFLGGKVASTKKKHLFDPALSYNEPASDKNLQGKYQQDIHSYGNSDPTLTWESGVGIPSGSGIIAPSVRLRYSPYSLQLGSQDGLPEPIVRNGVK